MAVLLVIVLPILVAAVYFYGVYKKRFKEKRPERELIEDALKNIYDSDGNSSVTSQSIAGVLRISLASAIQIVKRLREMGLTEKNTSSVLLTQKGKDYALKVIRVHRLLEKYYSEETGINETGWHEEAEKNEHLISSSEIETLAKKMGNPLYDPHGDPIPSAEGIVPPRRGESVQKFSSGDKAEVTHIEDEPEEIYDDLVKQGLYQGMKVRILEKDENQIIIRGNGTNFTLPIENAQQLNLRKIEPDEQFIAEYDRLSQLTIGNEATIIGVSKKLRGMQRRRIMDLGFVPGSKVTAYMVGNGGDPVAYQVKGGTVALRKEQSEWIFIDKVKA